MWYIYNSIILIEHHYLLLYCCPDISITYFTLVKIV